MGVQRACAVHTKARKAFNMQQYHHLIVAVTGVRVAGCHDSIATVCAREQHKLEVAVKFKVKRIVNRAVVAARGGNTFI
jgi:hypothetical protein